MSPRQTMSSPFLSLLAINSPSRDTTIANTATRCLSIFFDSLRLPSFKSHRRSVLSSDCDCLYRFFMTLKRPTRCDAWNDGLPKVRVSYLLAHQCPSCALAAFQIQ